MKRTKKFLVGFLAALSVLCGSLGLVACGGNDSTSNAGEKTEIEKVYAQYVVYAQAQGEEPLSYEEWLATIKGEKGDKGISIKSVELDKNGDLLITLTDGTTQTVEMPTVGANGANSSIDKGATENLHYQKIAGKEEYCVFGIGLASELDIVISSVYKGLPVTSIGESAFRDCTSLTGVVIPDSVTSIGNYAFSACTNLRRVEIGDSVKSIGNSAFSTCYKLVEVVNKSPHITISEGSEGNGYAGYYALDVYNSGATSTDSKISFDNGYIVYTKGKEKILVGYNGTETDLSLPAYITQINQGAFYNFKNLMSIEIPDSVTSIGYSAFRGCTGLTNVVVPDGVTSIGSFAFRACSSLTSVEIGDDVTSIGDYAFLDCESLTSIVIGDGVTNIGEVAFSSCKNLTSVTCPTFAISHIPKSKLQTVVITSGDAISEDAFSYCTSLTSVVIGDSVAFIGERAFRGCSSLLEITLPFVGFSKNATEYQSVFGYIFGYTMSSSITINGATRQYYSYSTYYHYYIPASLRKVTIMGGDISDNVFYNCTSLTSVVIGGSVESIGYSAFSGCSSLTSIEIPDSATSIGDHAFSSCTSLTSVKIGNRVTSIGKFAFYNCISLTSIVIPDSVTSIGNDAFYECTGLKSIEIPDSVTSIGSSAFEGCKRLTSVIIPDSVTSIGSNAFYECTSLTSVAIGDSVTRLGGCMFYKCTSLTSVVIGDSVTYIGNSAFYNCSGLTSVYYKGTASDWAEISIGDSNHYLTNATRYYYSENEPTTTGNWWHYNEQGEVVVWGSEN